MKKRILIPVVVLGLAVMACSLFIPTPRAPTMPPEPPRQVITPTSPTKLPKVATPAVQASPTTPSLSPTIESNAPVTSGPVEITGQFSYSNDIITTYYVEQASALIDMYGFITRNQEWEIPLAGQTLGYLQLDPKTHQGSFFVQLPAQPTGTLADVNPDGQQETGVQVFTVAYSPNLTGGPYSVGDDPSRGWPSYLASVKTDSENKDEVIGGKLVIWAPDGQQSFPSDFGADGLLFTPDDPVQPVPAGYSVIDLDQQPFAIERQAQPEMTLYEPNDVAIKDFSSLSYQEAFDKMFEVVRRDYAFNGIEGKQPNWDALYAELSPRVAEAQQNQDANAFYQVMRDFVLAFKDGHVNLNGGDVENQLFTQAVAGGYGFAIRELDDGRVIVVYVTDGGPAAQAGIQVGAQVTEFNGKPIGEAINAVTPWSAPHSTEYSLRYQQARYLLRAPLDTKATVTYANPGSDTQMVELTAVDERDSFSYTSTFRGLTPSGCRSAMIFCRLVLGISRSPRTTMTST